MILTLRTDKPDSEIGLFDGNQQIVYFSWPAHRQLAETLHHKINDVLNDQNKQLADITGIVAYKGPGSFTGLRIGLSVVNALAASYAVPVVATNGETWIQDGISAIANGATTTLALPEYGSAPNITAPKR